MRRASFSIAFFAAALSAAPAIAAPQGADVRARARGIAVQALSLFDKGQYAEALEAFDRADVIFRAPTHGLMAARCLVKLGRLVEAKERFAAVADVELARDASEVFREAKVDAGKELAQIEPRIPRVAVEIAGARAAELVATVDGKPATSPWTFVDPGRHRIEARQGDLVVIASEVALAEGEARRVTLTPPPPAAPAGDDPAAPLDAGAGSGADVWRILGWSGVGLGGAGIVIGGIAGGMALGEKGGLEDQGCDDGLCPRSAAADVDRYNALRTVSSVGFIAGALFAAGGAALLWTAPKRQERSAGAAVSPWIGLGGAGVAGSF